ncbi:MAG: hypothetical protein QOI19_1667, partial [Thermoleophilaceae bacterium]|nr:hypothetical protein [Thermoleophilaceae bacterium]
QAELRARAATVLAAGSIAGSLLAGRAAKGGTLDGFGLAAIAAYLGCVATSLYVLLPHELVLEFHGSVALDFAVEREADLPSTLRAVTGWLEEFHDTNRVVLRRLGRAYTAICILLGLEIVLWTASYGDRLLLTMAGTQTSSGGSVPTPRPRPTPPLPTEPPPGFGIPESRSE